MWVNELEGPVPSEIGMLSHLIYLDFENNKLTGTLPSELGRLKWLKSGLFSHNRFLNADIGSALCGGESDTGREWADLESDCLPGNGTHLQKRFPSAVHCPCCTQCCNIELGICCDFTGDRLFCSPTDYD
eukprot:CAMPEP_0119557042 /NCGR_PEP_ID=MMETSP1352-20130426/8831_1 /TAXON_ID=265584 /ORGANISM="Stauroneis constricta, Strain CCMP1120" /LENGTH=129 /DNA_ID=CAMNT_0007604079 /DNA_START=1 /DNA_END=390 /DNA_ORIENTATION=+